MAKDDIFSDMPQPQMNDSRSHGLRKVWMNWVKTFLGEVLASRQRKFNDYANKVRDLQEQVPARYIPAEDIEKMSMKYHRMKLSEGDYEALTHWVNKFAKEKVEYTGLLDQELYFKYTRLFYYSYVIRFKILFSKISSIFS